MFRDGELVCVDGFTGYAGRAAGPGIVLEENADDPDNRRVAPGLVPPPPGRRDRLAGGYRDFCAVVWLVGLAAFLCLPEDWVRQPAMQACDWIFWPIVRLAGKPAAVAIIAAALAVLVLLVQKFATDNRRLLEARRRASRLNRMAQSLPAGCPRQRQLAGLAARVTTRTLLAALTPLGLLLGPLLLPFYWFQQRMDPASASPPAGSAVQIVALVQGDWPLPVTIDLPPAFHLDESSPAERKITPLRPTLERLLALLRQPRHLPGEAWELELLPDPGRMIQADELEAYLAAGIPPQGITWLVRPDAGAEGKYRIAVGSPGHPAARLAIVLGEMDPPVAPSARPDSASPIRELRAVAPHPHSEATFWRPFAPFGGEASPRALQWLSTINVSWIWIYILSYLAALLVARRIFRVA
jgi:uncharacterized membrane protein (DUF106 family)